MVGIERDEVVNRPAICAHPDTREQNGLHATASDVQAAKSTALYPPLRPRADLDESARAVSHEAQLHHLAARSGSEINAAKRGHYRLRKLRLQQHRLLSDQVPRAGHKG